MAWAALMASRITCGKAVRFLSSTAFLRQARSLASSWSISAWLCWVRPLRPSMPGRTERRNTVDSNMARKRDRSPDWSASGSFLDFTSLLSMFSATLNACIKTSGAFRLAAVCGMVLPCDTTPYSPFTWARMSINATCYGFLSDKAADSLVVPFAAAFGFPTAPDIIFALLVCSSTF